MDLSKEKVVRRLIGVATVAVCALALALAAVIIGMTIKIQQSAADIYNHPYTVTSVSQEMKSHLEDMRLFVAVFRIENQEDQVALRSLLDTQYERQDHSEKRIRESYLGPIADVDELRTSIEALKVAQAKAVDDLLGESDDVKREEYLAKHVYPCYDNVYGRIKVIADFAARGNLRLEKQTSQARSTTIVAAVLFPLAIIAFAAFMLHSEKKRREADATYRENFDLLSNNIDDVFLIRDVTSQTFDYVSPNSERILGIESEEFRENGLDALRGGLVEEDAEKPYALFGDGVLHTQAECELRYVKHSKEHPRWLLFKIFPIKSGNQIKRYIIAISDRTEQLNVQQTLREALTVAQNANNAKKNFLSRMSHEIRTPMNAIIGMTTIAAAYLDDKVRVRDCLTKITFSSRQLLSLINDVLDMSKIEDNKLKVNYETFELKQLVDSVTAIIYSQCESKGLRFEERLLNCTAEILVGDSLRVNQILLNLLSNAVKFTPPGGSVTLDIRQIEGKDGGVRVRFIVSDTGIGMTEEFLQRLYLPFEQADASMAQRYGGTGLGMSISKNLVTLLGGAIDVQSAPGKGTTFTVELPFGLPQESVRRSHEHELKFLSVLVVDDDEDTCEHADLLLKKMGIRSQWVLSGEAAIELVADAHESGKDYDVCIIDWQMPEMDGIETTRRIRKLVGPDTIIIIISAYDWSAVETQARKAGANAFISKPLFASNLYNTLLSVTGKNKMGSLPRLIRKPHFKGKKILLAEDNDLNMEIAVEILRMAGAEIVCAVNGKEAVERYAASKPGEFNLILMDIQMPELNGYEASQLIRASGKEDAKTIPIFAMTANAFSEDVAAARENGMNGHIAKPIDVDQLYRLLEGIFSGADEKE